MYCMAYSTVYTNWLMKSLINKLIIIKVILSCFCFSILYIFHCLFPYNTQRHQLFFHPYFHVINGIDIPLQNLRYGYKM